MSPVCPRPAPLGERLALHTWTLDTTPLPEVLRAARAAGWPALELRRIDFARAADAGQTLSDYLLAEVERLASRPTRGEMLARIHGRSRVTLKTPAAEVIRDERHSA